MAKNYHINISDDWVAPEETLLDAGSEFSNLEQPIQGTAFSLAFWGVTVLFAVVVAVSGWMGVIHFDYFAGLAFQNRSVNFLVPPPRGLIFDTTGLPLVQNIPSFDLVAVSKEAKTLLDDDAALTSVAQTLQEDKEQLKNDLGEQSQAASIFFVAHDLTKDQILAVEYQHPAGLYVIPDVKRSYVDGPSLAHVVGYVGKVTKDDLAADSYYAPTDTIGRLGIESQYEDVLRGEHGRIFFGADADTLNLDAQAGRGVQLNIDASLQKTAYGQLRAVLASAGLTRGAVIVQNPQTGAVLALVSFPSFDSNNFADGLSQAQYKSIFENSDRPLFNRVVSGLYNPGSTIKPLMGMMGLQEGVITPTTTIQDCISITIPNPFTPGVQYTFKNWRADTGPFNLRRAIANSCNVFFFSVGGGFGSIRGLGIEKIDSYLKATLADSDLGIDLGGEEHGFVPTPQWKESERHENWYQGDTYNVSIGQGDLIVTPLWLNAYISAIANGGTLYKPEVAKAIVDNNKNPIQTFEPQQIGSLPFDGSVISEIKSDMQETVLSGTAQTFKDLPVTVGAKTGTAEVVKGRSINSLFTAFAPMDNPQIALTVLVEGSASNQGLAIQVAHAIMKQYFAPPASPTPSPAPAP